MRAREGLALAALGKAVLYLGDDVDERNRHNQIVGCGANVGCDVARGGREVLENSMSSMTPTLESSDVSL